MYSICLLFACLFIFVFEGLLSIYLFVYVIYGYRLCLSLKVSMSLCF
jgi:hypothetical protein